MNQRAWGYIIVVYVLGAALTIWSFANIPLELSGTFLAFLLFSIVAQSLKVTAPFHQLYYTTGIFQFASVLLLSPPLYVTTVIVSYLVEWIKERMRNSSDLRAWYIQPFNIATHIIAGLAAQLWIRQTGSSIELLEQMSNAAVIAIASAAIIYVVLNHALIALALILARGVTLRESGILDVENLGTDLVLLMIGCVVGVLWLINPLLIVMGLTPLALIYRALMIPRLKEEAHLDGKTGLLNAHHFMSRLTEEFQRAQTSGQPFAVFMADLDLLRNINNTYGHLAGDAVLAGIGKIIRQTVRNADVAGRFGGEEFAVVLPNLDVIQAQLIAERLRRAVETALFEVDTTEKPIQATISIGVAGYPQDGATIKQLIHEADIAVYQAKLQGRNRVVCREDVPHSFTLGMVTDNKVARSAPSEVTPFVPRPQPPQEMESSPVQTEAAPATEGVPAPPLIGMERRAPSAFQAEQEQHTPSPAPSEKMPQQAQVAIWGLVLAALVLTVLSVWHFVPAWSAHRMMAALVFATLALASEVLQIDLYGDNSVSVSMAFLFGVGLLVGIPGVVVVSAIISITHYIRRRPDPRKTLTNWAIHVLAGLAPWLMTVVVPVPLSLSALPLLLLPTVVAALLYFVIEMGLFSVVIGLAQRHSPLAVWRQQFQWLAPQWIVLGIFGLFLSVGFESQGVLGICILIMPLGMLRYTQHQYLQATTHGIQELRRLNRELNQANEEVIAASHSIHQLNDDLFLTLARIIDARDPFVSGHAAKVAEYAVAIGERMGLDAVELGHIRQAGFLHDIGKLGIPDSILHKPARLTAEEYEYMKTHAPLGGNLLETSQNLKHLAPFVRYHHERWDGNGYPQRLKAESIPLGARILALCDAVEAMSSDRPYQRGKSLDEVIAEVERCAGSHFDPAVVEAFLAVLAVREGNFLVNSAQEVLNKSGADLVWGGDEGGQSFQSLQRTALATLFS